MFALMLAFSNDDRYSRSGTRTQVIVGYSLRLVEYCPTAASKRFRWVVLCSVLFVFASARCEMVFFQLLPQCRCFLRFCQGVRMQEPQVTGSGGYLRGRGTRMRRLQPLRIILTRSQDRKKRNNRAVQHFVLSFLISVEPLRLRRELYDCCLHIRGFFL